MDNLEKYIDEQTKDLKQEKALESFCDEEINNMNDRLQEMDEMIKEIDKQMKDIEFDKKDNQ